MFISQLSVFIENRQGSLAAITGVLADAHIDIRAFSLADTADFGVLRMIVNDPERAAAALRDAGITVSLNRVLAAEMRDEPGALHALLALLSDAGIVVEYAYAFVSHVAGQACAILRVDDRDRTAALLDEKGVPTLSPQEVFGS